MNSTTTARFYPEIHSDGGAVAERYLSVRHTTRQLCAPLTADDQMVQSTPEASPAKWHQAHTTWFFETFLLAPHAPGYQPYHPAFRSLFNSYYKQVGAHPLRTIRSTFSRPSLEEVLAYRHHVDEHVVSLLTSSSSGELPSLASLVELGINHEQQHQELILTDIKHAFWTNPLQPGYLNRPLGLDGTVVPKLHWIDFDAGLHGVGHRGSQFAYDNEQPRHQVYLEPFRLASRLVTNGEYMEFMRAGGYQRPELWLSDGWDAIVAHQWTAPLYWEQTNTGWKLFTLTGVRELRPEEPVVHVSYYEADAFARWSGAHLPSEEEWEVAAADLPVEGNLMETGRYHPSAVSENRGLQLNQMFGDVWEWTRSPYVAYPGFQPAVGALGEYNGKFMCNQFVLRGGSCATPASHIRASYRNFFPPQSRWQFAGIRLADGRI